MLIYRLSIIFPIISSKPSKIIVKVPNKIQQMQFFKQDASISSLMIILSSLMIICFILKVFRIQSMSEVCEQFHLLRSSTQDVKCAKLYANCFLRASCLFQAPFDMQPMHESVYMRTKGPLNCSGLSGTFQKTPEVLRIHDGPDKTMWDRANDGQFWDTINLKVLIRD